MQGGHGYSRIHASHKCLSPAGCALLYAHAGPYEYSEYGTNRSLVKPRIFRDDDALLVQPPLALATGGEAKHRTEARALLVTALDEARSALGAEHLLTRRVEAALAAVEELASQPDASSHDEGEAAHWAAAEAHAAGDVIVAVLLHAYVTPCCEQPLEVRRRALASLIENAWAAGAVAIEALASLDGDAQLLAEAAFEEVAVKEEEDRVESIDEGEGGMRVRFRLSRERVHE